MNEQISRKLKMLGMLLFLIGLLTGCMIMTLKNPRMGLAAHLEGVMNGMFLVIAGLVWNELKISIGLKKVLFPTLVYGTFMNWFFTLLAAVFGTSKMTPITGAGYLGNGLQENLITGGLASVGLTMVFSLVVIIYGLRGKVNNE